MFKNQEDHFKYIREKLESIEDQTKKTNGRVDSLENWRGYITGGLAVISAIVIPLAIIIFKTLI